jgi:hypothetical protein
MIESDPWLEVQRGFTMTNTICVPGATGATRALTLLASLAIVISATGIAQTPLISPAVVYNSGGFDALSVAVADVNGDGKPDLVVASLCASGTDCQYVGRGRVGVLLGNGDGTFQAAVAYDSGGVNARFVAVADVNGDGKADVLVANYCDSSGNCNANGPGSVGVLLGNGDGTFQAAVAYGSGSFDALFVAVADVNGDGKADLVVGNCQADRCGNGSLGGTVGVLLGNGDGTFQTALSYGSGGQFAYSVAVADVNGDGKPDLVVANYCDGSRFCGNGSVGVLLGNGDGTFRAAVPYSAKGFADSIAIADVNGDGQLDVLVADFLAPNSSRSRVGVLLGNGDGTFQAATAYGSGGAATVSIAIGDVDGDGKLDLLVANECITVGTVGTCANGSVGVLLGNGNGTFQPAATYKPDGAFPSSVAVADVNRDGKPDLVVASRCDNNISCKSGVVGVLFPTSITLASSLNPSLYGQKVTFTARVTGSGPVPPTGTVVFMWKYFTTTYTIGSATLNSSGVATLTKSNLNANAFPMIAVYRGDTNNLSSTSAVLNQTVQQTTSAAALTSSVNPSTVGQAITFTAKITSPTVTPSGPVTFKAGTTVLGTAQLSSGKATFTTSTMPAGSTVVKVIYNGNSNIRGSSATITQVVQP